VSQGCKGTKKQKIEYFCLEGAEAVATRLRKHGTNLHSIAVFEKERVTIQPNGKKQNKARDAP
jgi:hypothetical protein